MPGCHGPANSQVTTDDPKGTHSDAVSIKSFGGDEADRTYNMGRIIGGGAAKPEHDYVLKNLSNRNVRILEFVNAKPCCGEVDQIEPKTLAPGQSVTLKVRIKAGETLGKLSHRAQVRTDLSGASEIEFWTLADVIPRTRPEETTRKTTPLFPGQLALRDFVAISCGTKSDPPLALDDATVKASTGLTWGGLATESRSDDEIVETRRPFTIELKADGPPGTRQAEVSIVEGKNILLNHLIHWEVASCLKASPAGFIIKEELMRIDKQIIMRSMNGCKFALLDAASSLPGVVVVFKGSEVHGSHVLAVKIDPSPANRGKIGQVTITTNHPSQRVVTVSVFVSAAS